MRSRPLKLIEIPSCQETGQRFFAKVPDGMPADRGVMLVNAIIKRANLLYASASGAPDIGAVYDTIARDLASAGFVLEARLEVRTSGAWDRAGALSDEEQRLISELDARQVEVEAPAEVVAA